MSFWGGDVGMVPLSDITITLKTVVLGVTLSVALTACGDAGQALASADEQEFTKPPEYVLAVLEADRQLPDDHPNVSKFRTLLESVAAKCKNDRREISDITIEVHNILSKKGVNFTLYELLTRINSTIPNSDSGHLFDFRKIAQAFQGLAASLNKAN